MSTIDIDIQVDFLEHDRTVPLQGGLVWHSLDPLAVLLIPTRQQPHVWHMGRDLVAAGMHDRVGNGDVIVQPHTPNPQLVRIDLRSPDGSASLALDRRVLGEFLRETYLQVSVDEESRIARAALDMALPGLFREVQP